MSCTCVQLEAADSFAAELFLSATAQWQWELRVNAHVAKCATPADMWWKRRDFLSQVEQWFNCRLLQGFDFAGHWKLDDGWPESEKDVFQAALRMVVVKDSR